ncbi:IS30 family transposase [Candidatus Woesebacteria bacterium]|nr:IS30 family transposase [Candidatus Woesebacteria bacterium]
MKKIGKLTPQERDRLAILLAKGVKLSEIARRLDRSKSTISDEIKRNRRWDREKQNFVYEAIFAQEEADQRMVTRRKRPRLKNKWIYRYVTQHLGMGWSPEQIEGRLKLKHKGDYHKTIGHEAIYQYVFDPQNKKEGLWEYLPRKQKKRKKQKGRGVHHSRIPDRISIHSRPGTIERRTEFGHFEGDTVEGRRSVGDGIHTEVERVSRITFAVKVKEISSTEGVRAQKEIFGELPEKARRSTTLDNGKENHLHFKLKTELNMDTYFADPYSSWQRGTNEYHNGLIRRYLPKGTDFSDLTQDELDDILWEINNRPRKCLGYYTPLEVFNKHLTDRSDSK